LLYIKSKLPDAEGSDSKDKMRSVSAGWKLLSDKKKRKYTKKLAKLQARYPAQLEEYKQVSGSVLV
jgi:hypothetical protein